MVFQQGETKFWAGKGVRVTRDQWFVLVERVAAVTNQVSSLLMKNRQLLPTPQGAVRYSPHPTKSETAMLGSNRDTTNEDVFSPESLRRADTNRLLAQAIMRGEEIGQHSYT
jgi:hypothetical protein